MPVAVVFGELRIAKPWQLWINDGLMAVFFLLVSLEIKRESLTGQLAGLDRLMLPMVCAAAGVAVPALLFKSEEHTSELQSLMRISYAVFCLKKKKKCYIAFGMQPTL